MQNLQSLVPFLDELAEAASEAILPHFRTQMAITDKYEDKADGGIVSDIDPVTVADRNAEAAMRRLIEQRFPDHGIIGEEYGDDRPEAEHVWVLDPIDGTRAFICGLPLWGVLIGLRHHNTPVLGMVAQPHIGERFAGTGDAAWLTRAGRKTPLRIRECTGIAQATLSTTGPNMFSGEDLARFQAVAAECRLLRYGYDCYAYAMLAMGFIDCVVESSLKPFDIEPIIPIILGAGGIVTDWQGNPTPGNVQVIAAGDQRVIDEVAALLN